MFDKLISSAKLVTTPDTRESLSIWTDYCELQCLSSDLIKIDADQLCDIAIKSLDFKSGDEIKHKDRKEKITSKIKDVYTHILLRGSLLLDKYPFIIDADGQISLKNGILNDIQKLYIILLCASNLKYMQSINFLTSDLEVISLLYMRKLFPEMVFKFFGSSNVNNKLDKDDFFSATKLKDKLNSLADFISVTAEKDIVENIKDYDVGDGGLDIVGIRDMGDKRKSIPVMFGQCACGRDAWSDKQLSISDLKWVKYIKCWMTSIQNYIFIPCWYMNSDKQFEDETKITYCVLVDRLRFMNIADDTFLSKCCSLD